MNTQTNYHFNKNDIQMISELQDYEKPVLSVGVEFVVWAEKYWNLEKQFSETEKNPAEKGGENCPYNIVREAFINKIDEIISQRVRNYL